VIGLKPLRKPQTRH